MNKLLKFLIALTISSISLSANADYTFSLLAGLGSNFRDALSINASNQVVGYSEVRVGGNWEIHATLWSGGSVTDLGPGIATSINTSGQAVGYYNSRIGSIPMVWTGSESTGFGNIQGATSINSSGQIAGNKYGNGITHAVVVSNAADVLTTATYTELSGLGGASTYANSINDNGQVVGNAQLADNMALHATLWSNGTVTDLGAGNAYTINNMGWIVGSSNSHATLWSNSTVIDLGTLGGVYSFAYSINNAGLVVGSADTASNNQHAFLYNGTSLIDLNSYLDASLVDSGWVLNTAKSINDSGSIVGTASNSILGIQSQAFLLSSVAAVPELNTNLMLLIGLSLFGFVARKSATV